MKETKVRIVPKDMTKGEQVILYLGIREANEVLEGVLAGLKEPASVEVSVGKDDKASGEKV